MEQIRGMSEEDYIQDDEDPEQIAEDMYQNMIEQLDDVLDIEGNSKK